MYRHRNLITDAVTGAWEEVGPVPRGADDDGAGMAGEEEGGHESAHG